MSISLNREEQSLDVVLGWLITKFNEVRQIGTPEEHRMILKDINGIQAVLAGKMDLDELQLEYSFH